jgi:hypothetical protein
VSIAQRKHGGWNSGCSFLTGSIDRAVAPEQCTRGEVGPREPITDQEPAFPQGVIQLVKRGHQTLLGLMGRFGVYVHERGHRNANLGVDEREQGPPIPGCSIEQKSESAIAVRKRVVVEPQPDLNANLVVQILLPLQGFFGFLSVAWLVAVLFVASAFLAAGTYNPFIYFRF